MRRFFVIAAIALVIAAPRLGSAGEPTGQIKGRVDTILKTVQSPQFKGEGKTEERRAAIRKIAEQTFDFEETSKRALGQHWQSRTPTERQEFVRLFTDLLEDSYVSKIEQYSSEKIAYAGETIDGDRATVKTRIVTPKGTEIPIDYRMARADNRWLVYDVIIEGVSLVGNYRTQFNKIIQTSSWNELMQKMRAKAFNGPEGRRG